MKIKISFDTKYNFLLSILSGVILGFSFPPFKFGILAIIGLVPLLLVLSNENSLKKVFKFSYLTFFVFNLIACYWVGGWGKETDFFLMLSGIALTLIHPFFFTIPIIFFSVVKKYLNEVLALISLPFIWVAFEYLHSITEFAFPWLLLGNSQTYNVSSIQYITYTGVYGISFWIVTTNVLIYYIYNKFSNNELSKYSINSFFWALLVIFWIFSPYIISKIILKSYEENKKSKYLRVAIIQPNIDPWEKWKKSKEFEQVLFLLDKSNSIVQDNKVDLIIWPETAIPFYIRQPSRNEEMQIIHNVIDSIGVNILTGAADLKIYSNNEYIPPSAKKFRGSEVAYNSYNSIFLFEPNNNNIQIYHKIKLVPFSERIPYLDAYPFMINFLEWGVGISNWGIGQDSTIFYIKLNQGSKNKFSKIDENNINSVVKFWAMVCYESIFPGFVSEFVKKGAEFLVIVTNDSWFGNSSGPYQHNQYAVLRAIENRKSIARCANGGISSIIDPTGNIIMQSKFDSQDILLGDIEVNSYQTFYSKNGDVFSIICLYISLLFIFFSYLNKFYKIIKRKNKWIK